MDPRLCLLLTVLKGCYAFLVNDLALAGAWVVRFVRGGMRRSALARRGCDWIGCFGAGRFL